MMKDYAAINIGSPTSESDWHKLFEQWENSYENWLKEDVTREQARSCRSAAVYSARQAWNWCKSQNLSSDEINEKLWSGAALIHDLYEALPPSGSDCPALSRHLSDSIWRHIDLGSFLRLAKKRELDEPLDYIAVKRSADNYIARDWLESPYLDWLFVDLLIFAVTIGGFHYTSKIKYGAGYSIFEEKWKVILFRYASIPFLIILNWLFPAVICIILYDKHPIISLLIAIPIFGYNTFSIVRYYSRLVFYFLKNGRTPRSDLINRLKLMESAYDQLQDNTIHVPSLRLALEKGRDAGIKWDPQVFSIVDRATLRNPIVWIRPTPYE